MVQKGKRLNTFNYIRFRIIQCVLLVEIFVSAVTLD